MTTSPPATSGSTPTCGMPRNASSGATVLGMPEAMPSIPCAAPPVVSITTRAPVSPLLISALPTPLLIMRMPGVPLAGLMARSSWRTSSWLGGVVMLMPCDWLPLQTSVVSTTVQLSGPAKAAGMAAHEITILIKWLLGGENAVVFMASLPEARCSYIYVCSRFEYRSWFWTAPNLSFFSGNGMDPEYTVIGCVARRHRAVVMKNKYGANERSQKLKCHVQTPGRSLQAVIVIYDNCNSLHAIACDEAITSRPRSLCAVSLCDLRGWCRGVPDPAVRDVAAHDGRALRRRVVSGQNTAPLTGAVCVSPRLPRPVP